MKLNPTLNTLVISGISVIVALVGLMGALPCKASSAYPGSSLSLSQKEQLIRSQPEMMRTFEDMGYTSAEEVALAFEVAEQFAERLPPDDRTKPEFSWKTALCLKGGYSIFIGIQGAICATLTDAYRVTVLSPGFGLALGLNTIFFRSPHLETEAFYRGVQLAGAYGYGAELGYFSEYRCQKHSTEMEDALNCKNSIPRGLRGDLITVGLKLGAEGTLGFSAKIERIKPSASP